jgi:glycosyltransferase involved in cell wall biosynthesis
MDEKCAAVDVLMVSELGLWPLDQGFKVHGSQMARALSERGLKVAVATIGAMAGEAPAWLREMQVEWPAASEEEVAVFKRGWDGWGRWLRQRVARHQGAEAEKFAGVIGLVKKYRPAAVVALGPHGPVMLRGLKHVEGVEGAARAKRIWYAADDLVYFQLSCLRLEGWRGLRRRVRPLVVYALVERLFARGLDAAVGVSPTDTRWLKRLAGVKEAVTIRNGVDVEHYGLRGERRGPESLVFWGRMDFEPNVDAVCWFAKAVWPEVRRMWPGARWQIVGKNPAEAVKELDALPGVAVLGEVADVRPYARSAAAVILPMRCGGGIKNKLLEAAAMGLAIVSSERAVKGLELPGGEGPVRVCGSKGEWVKAIGEIFGDATVGGDLGQRASEWVRGRHTWGAAAREMVELMERIGCEKVVIRTDLMEEKCQTRGAIEPKGGGSSDSACAAQAA